MDHLAPVTPTQHNQGLDVWSCLGIIEVILEYYDLRLSLLP